jgi:hypothetical protein
LNPLCDCFLAQKENEKEKEKDDLKEDEVMGWMHSLA